MVQLSNELYENATLLDDSRRRVEKLLDVARDAFSKPNVTSFVEDYLVSELRSLARPCGASDFVADNRQLLGQILRAETKRLSDDEISDAVSHCISFSRGDIAIVDWNAAILLDPEAEDSLAVLEFANMELVEMRYLDQRLDEALDLAYDTLAKRA